MVNNGIIYYGVNVGTKNNMERYLTFTSYKEAKKVFDVLIMGNEKDLWECVEIEKIEEVENKDFTYDVVLWGKTIL